ncbi:MAG: hypothetical protein GX375_07485 [Clostridiales bacterium]|nr:hypothetical protein [Clostridiales bacterium]
MFEPLKVEIKKEKTKVNSLRESNKSSYVESKKIKSRPNALHRPRSRAFIRAIKDLDVLTDNDVEVRKKLEQMTQSKQAASTIVSTDCKNSDLETVPEIGTDGFESQKQALLESIRSTIINTMQFMPDEFVGILAGCGLPGCYIHLIDDKGNILKHYKCGEALPERLNQGYLEMQKHDQVSHVEVYEHHICVIDNWGQSKTINKLVL